MEFRIQQRQVLVYVPIQDQREDWAIVYTVAYPTINQPWYNAIGAGWEMAENTACQLGRAHREVKLEKSSVTTFSEVAFDRMSSNVRSRRDLISS